MNESQLLLQKAIEDKARIKVIYHGGSMAGKLREISPISIKDAKLRAKCHIGNAVKTFIVDKMQVMEESTGELSQETFREKVRPKFKTLNELHKYCEEKIDSTKLVIQSDAEFLTIHGTFKNGKAKKACEIGISYEEVGLRFLDGFGEETETFIKERPWSVFGKKHNSVAYKYFDKATDKFIDCLEVEFTK